MHRNEMKRTLLIHKETIRLVYGRCFAPLDYVLNYVLCNEMPRQHFPNAIVEEKLEHKASSRGFDHVTTAQYSTVNINTFKRKLSLDLYTSKESY